MIKINSPCHQNFSKMPINGNGRYCISCEKTVVDFTNMSEVEVLNYFKTYQGNQLCGRIKANKFGKQTAFQNFLFNSKQLILNKVNSNPIRITLLALISGLLTFTTSCMGKMMPMEKQTKPTNDSLQTKTPKH